MKTTYPTKRHTPNPRKGFTLVELIISISIITLFSLVLFIKHNQFGESIAINNLAYETALALREAQVFGISVREESGQGFDSAYGVRFRNDDLTRFISFIDLNGNRAYISESVDPNELIEEYSITKGNRISDICVLENGVESCHSSGGLSAVHVTFLRPDPDAVFRTSPNKPNTSEVSIYLESPKGLQKIVRVTSTGQISIE